MLFSKENAFDGYADVRGFSSGIEPPRFRRKIPFYRVVRKDAARCLFRRWGKAAAGFLFLTGIWMLCSLLRTLIRQAASVTGAPFALEGRTLVVNLPRIFVDGGLIFASAILFSPLVLGYIRFIYQLTTGREAPLMMIFDSLRSMRTLLWSMGSVITMWLGSMVILTVCLLPGALTLFSAGTFPGSDGKKAALRIAMLLLGGVLLIIGLLFAIALLVRFIAVPFILTDEHTGIFQAAALSWRATRREADGVFSLVISFLPLFLLCILLIPAIFVIPYFIASSGLYARVLLDREIQRRNMESGR